jgi:hypothetical protein
MFTHTSCSNELGILRNTKLTLACSQNYPAHCFSYGCFLDAQFQFILFGLLRD